MPKAKKAAKRKTTVKKSNRKVKGDCVIPPRVPDPAINEFAFTRNDTEANHIVEYVEWQCEKDRERVTFLEKCSLSTLWALQIVVGMSIQISGNGGLSTAT